MRLTKAVLWIPLVFVSHALADEAADRLAIGHAIAALNDPSQEQAVFTERGDGRAEFARLRLENPRGFRIVGPSSDLALTVAGYPTVTISHEPWGEATIVFPGQPQMPHGAVAFVTADVALAEGAYTFQDDDGLTRSKALLFVMKKEAGEWKIGHSGC